MLNCFSRDAKHTIPISLVAKKNFSTWLKQQDKFLQSWLASIQFNPEIAAYCLVPDAEGRLNHVICMTTDLNLWSAGALPFLLPETHVYHLKIEPKDYADYAIGWGLGAYQFTRYKKPQRLPAKLVLPAEIDADYVSNIVESIYWVRDLINTPTDDMGPSELAAEAYALRDEFKATVDEVVGEDLLKNNYASIYTVGRASDDLPRLIDLRWGNINHPRVTLVGKGVCFDTGGLDIKNSGSMLLMKKDMGGAAYVLGLARMIMRANLPICLRVLIPAVENAIGGNAYRPGDIIKSRKGLTIEIGNTDAEGRVILADALTEAVSEKPELLIDISTLTGAARIALGTELPGFFTNDDAVASELTAHSLQKTDPIWRLPLFSLYRESLNSMIADINNASTDGYGGAITAALFLKEFVPDEIPWVHYDLMAWNQKTRPGRPQGGEAMGLRGLFGYLKHRFGSSL